MVQSYDDILPTQDVGRVVRWSFSTIYSEMGFQAGYLTEDEAWGHLRELAIRVQKPIRLMAGIWPKLFNGAS